MQDCRTKRKVIDLFQSVGPCEKVHTTLKVPVDYPEIGNDRNTIKSSWQEYEVPIIRMKKQDLDFVRMSDT
jgi:hypothetical protein